MVSKGLTGTDNWTINISKLCVGYFISSYTIVLTNQITADQYIQEVLVIPHFWHFCKRLKTIKVNQKPSQTESAESQIRQLLGESYQTKDDSPCACNPAGSR